MNSKRNLFCIGALVTAAACNGLEPWPGVSEDTDTAHSHDEDDSDTGHNAGQISDTPTDEETSTTHARTFFVGVNSAASTIRSYRYRGIISIGAPPEAQSTSSKTHALRIITTKDLK